MYRLKLLFLLSLCWHSAQAAVLPEQWHRVGQAELKVLWFDIYHAELLTSDGHFVDLNEPLLLRLTYQRNISQQSLLQETEKELLRFAQKEQVNAWVKQLALFWPDVKAGDQLVFFRNTEQEGHFFFNGNWLGMVPGPVFGHAFSSIWLSEQSRFPALAASLRGEKPNESID